jgi:voltage-gated potassium channel Kch
VLSAYRHAYLLASLLLLILVRPFVGEQVLGLALLNIFLLATLATCVLTCSVNRIQVGLGLGLTAALLITNQLHDITGHPALGTASSALGLVFFGYITSGMLRHLFLHTRRVSADTICGALSVYLLMGVAWAFAYALLELAEPSSFSFGAAATGREDDFARFLSFSFVTLTTLGYGDVVPVTPKGNSLATTEAIVGQIYLTVLVARLVAIHLRHSDDGCETRTAGD